MKELNKYLDQACEKYEVTSHAYEALCKTSSLDLRERFVEALGYCGRKIIYAYDNKGKLGTFSMLIDTNKCQQIEQEWRNAYFDLLDLYNKVK